MLEDSGFTDITIGPAADTFGGATGENNARAFEVYGYAFLARSPAGVIQTLMAALLEMPASSPSDESTNYQSDRGRCT